MDDHGPVRSVARAAAILGALEGGPRSLGRIAARTSLSKPTAHRLLASLAYRQMVVQDPATFEYLLGPGCLRIADAIMRGAAGIGASLMGPMRDLEAATGETVALYVRTGLERVCIGQVPSSQPVRYTAHVGASYPLHTGAMGKVLLAFTPERERADLLDRLPLVALTEATVTRRDQLEAELAHIRDAGFAITSGERAAGVAAVSAPVFGADGQILAALSIVGPANRLGDATPASVREQLLACAALCTDRISARG